jgi:hypothetical protein
MYDHASPCAKPCPLGVVQFQTNDRQTAAKRAADRRFLGIDWALIIISRDVPRTVGGAATLRGEQFRCGIRDTDENHPQVEQGRHERQNRRFLPAVQAGGGTVNGRLKPLVESGTGFLPPV